MGSGDNAHRMSSSRYGWSSPLQMPSASYSTDSLASGSRSENASHSNVQSAVPTAQGSQISILNMDEQLQSPLSTSDYVEFDMGHEDYKTGVFSSDRMTINKKDSFKAKLVKLGKDNDMDTDKAEQLFKDETEASVFKAPQLETQLNTSQLNTVKCDSPKDKPDNLHGGSSTRLDKSIKEDEDEDEDEDSELWSQMETAADDDMYDERGQIVSTNNGNDQVKDKPALNANSGYTRIAAEEQAELYKEADKKTDFLFKASQKPSIDTSKNYYNGWGSDDDDFDDEDDDQFENNNLHQHSQTPVSQLQTTKKLFQDDQKFAYVGLVKLVMNEMATDLAKQTLSKKSRSSRSRWVKRMNLSQANLGQWQYRLSDRLFSHLDLSKEEIHMVESLSAHGISPEDLAKSLKVHAVVDNPAFEEGTKSNHSSSIDVSDQKEHQNSVLRPEDIASEKKIEIDVAWTVLCDLFLVLLADSVYDSRSRTLFLKFGRAIGLIELEIYQFERRITSSLQMEDASEQVWNETEHLESRRKGSKKKKLMYVGIATIGGSLVLGLSAGLLAPVIGAGIAAGLTTIGIGGTSGFLAGAGGTALVTVTGTAIGARIGSNGMNKRVGDVKTFEFIPLHNNKRVNLIITVSGWMNSKADDIRLPFSTVDPVMGDLYSLLWEPELLQSTGQTISILATEAITQSVQQILGATILMALMSAVQIPMALSKLSYLLDNPWNVSLDRAWKAGLVLADTLISRNLGVRPVTLVGFSLGSRVIYSCLLELAKRGAYGLVEKVVLFGSPLVVSNDDLALARSSVSGQYINGYSKKDWILGYLFRATSGGLRRVAGLSPIENMEGIENFDCTPYVQGHMEYRKAMPHLLSLLDFQVLAEEFVEIDDPDPEQTERQRKLILEFDEARKQMESEKASGKRKGLWNKWFGPKKKDWWSVYSEGSASSGTSKDDHGSEHDYGFDVDDVMKEVEQLKVKDTNVKESRLESSLNSFQSNQNENKMNEGKESESKDLNGAFKAETVQEERSAATKKKSINDVYDDDDEFKGEENITMSFSS